MYCCCANLTSSSPPFAIRAINAQVSGEDTADGRRDVMLVLEEVDGYLARVRIKAGLLLSQVDFGIPERMWLLKYTILHLLMRKMY